MSELQYVISARDRKTGITEAIAGPMPKDHADAWKPGTWYKKSHTYFRVSLHPFKSHKKGGR